jgi:hypothetical protein
MRTLREALPLGFERRKELRDEHLPGAAASWHGPEDNPTLSATFE